MFMIDELKIRIITIILSAGHRIEMFSVAAFL